MSATPEKTEKKKPEEGATDVALGAAPPLDKDKKKKEDPAADPAATPTEEDDSVGLDGLDLDVDAPASTPGEQPADAESALADVSAEDAAAMRELEGEAMELGIEVHASAHKSLLAMVQHFCTALKTHKATGGTGAADADANQPEPNDPNQPANDPNKPNEAELSESAPIMMSAVTPLTPREKTMLVGLLRQSVQGLTARIGVLLGKGIIDKGIKDDLMAKLGTVRLSMSDIADDGNIKPNEVAIRVDAYERLPAPKAAAPTKTPPKGTPNPDKPISSTVALSGADEEVAMDPPGSHEEQDRFKEQNAAGDELANRAMANV